MNSNNTVTNIESSDNYESLYFCANAPIDTLKLPAGKLNALAELGITNLLELVDNLPKLHKLWGFGQKTLALIYNELIQHSIDFGACVRRSRIPIRDFNHYGICTTSSIEQFADYISLLRRDHMVLA